MVRGKRTGKTSGKFRGFEGAVTLDATLTRTYKGKPCFRIYEGSAECRPWVNGNDHSTILTADRYDEAVGNNYVQQVMSRLSPQTLDAVRNWIMFACVLGIIVFQFWLYNEAQKDLEALKLLLNQHLAASQAAAGAQPVRL